MEENTFLVDVDDTVLNLVDPWLAAYNFRWCDNVKRTDIETWEIHKYTKIGEDFYRFLTPKLYRSVKPIPGALEGVRALKNIGRVIFVTSFLPDIAGVKFKLLKKYGFIETTKEYIETYSKHILNGFMIDDAPHNIEGFKGRKILYSQPWNENMDFSPRASNWAEVLYHIGKII